MRLQACDELFAVLLLADNTRHWLGLAHAKRLDLVFCNAFACEVRGHGSGATLGELLVVLLRTETIGVTGHEYELKLLHFLDARNDFAVKHSLAFSFQH